MAEAPTAQQRKKEPVAIPIVPDEECGSEDEDNLFAGTPSEKLSRKSKSKSKSKSGTKAKAARTDDGETDAFSPLIDVLRVLSFLAVASCALSYVMSSGESFTWGFNDKPWYLRPSYWKLRWNGPLYLTPAELRAYDGTTPDTPIYLAINHTIYDVSANPRSYGDFFGNSDRYQRVGYVRLPEGWPAGAPVPRLCDKAQKGRVKRKLPGQEEEERKAKEERRAAKKREKEAEKAGKPWLKT
ncbi:hypothetical protein BN1723_006108 [Verticillium longisporum]|uniref:Cytochrome b5 heme-binding domain-containing protein n=1 Tax=Verticillium longisporum TaxID=100787 RepID=A0A0G4NCU2_VERLO|nr:hypothetical protein BN1723_006108 [Verticillium longisporum]